MPLTREDSASEGGAVKQELHQYKQRDLIKVQFSQGKVLSHNLGEDVSLDKMSADQKSVTGKSQGFFEKFGSKEISK